MLTDIEIYGGPKRDTLAIPMEALIDDGLRKRVVKQLDDGRFQVSEVVTGMQTKGAVEILAGLSEGEQIVVSGQFLIDSESQIQENLRRLMSVDTSNKPSQSESGFDQIDHSGHAH
jgi:Cu(I)/Ag(I) efflux system membrane fusion protein